MTDTAIRLVIADEHPIFRLGIRTLLATAPGLALVAEAEDGERALSLVQEHKPDILLFDLQLPRLNGLELLKRLSPLGLETRPVVLTASIERSQMHTALMRGARGVLLKDVATELLTKCVKRVMQGEYWVGREDVGHLVDALRNPTQAEDSAGGLTTREKEIAELIVTGAANKDIAWRLGLSEQTIKNHLRKIFEKLHVRNRVELAMMAKDLRLASPRDERPQ